MLQQDDRRGYGRIELDESLHAAIDETAVHVIELSVTGFKVEHDVRFAPAVSRDVRVEWRSIPLRFSCSVVRSVLFRLARRAGDKSIYHSGVHILRAYGDSEMVLRNLIAERVIRALEEQKANARGLPPIGDLTAPSGKGDRFIRCELVDGQWKRAETTRSVQPNNGFTISADVDPFHVDLLCSTFAETTEEGRRLTRMLAELSIDKNEGGPVRRYWP